MIVIDWQHFTPWSALTGGLLIGLAAAVLLLFNGRILGVSGIVGGLIGAKTSDRAWRLTFLLGMALAPVTLSLIAPAAISAPQIDAGSFLLAIAGLLVGFGTRMGSGCTSGHGVCGISRVSLRSLAATGIFMIAGFVTVYLLRHTL